MHDDLTFLSVLHGHMQGPEGCQQMQWRNQPGGYLREILTARVYDVAVRTLPACMDVYLNGSGKLVHATPLVRTA